MKALLVIDAQNEFSDDGRRSVPAHDEILARIQWHIRRARENGEPIAWLQHHNKPDESPAFLPGSWGAELSPGLEPKSESGLEKLFQKNVF
jgi:nicotinamidase-related amidase